MNILAVLFESLVRALLRILFSGNKLRGPERRLAAAIILVLIALLAVAATLQ